MIRSLLLCACLALSACVSNWATDYETALDPTVSRSWQVSSVSVLVPDELTVSEANTFAPNADIVWHGDLPGDRKQQVAAMLKSGTENGAAGLNGSKEVTIRVALHHFHGVTPITLARAPSAVHNIMYTITVLDAKTQGVLAGPDVIRADLAANVGGAAIIAAQNGVSEKNRIVHHIATVTRGWLGIGPDPRTTFTGLGR